MNKKVSLFGKNKVCRELYNLHDITGTMFIKNLKPKELNLKISALKWKLRFYKKEHEFHKISLGSGKLSLEQSKEVEKKIEELCECYKKTFDILNLYVESLEKNKNLKDNNDENKLKSVKSSKSILEIVNDQCLDVQINNISCTKKVKINTSNNSISS